MAVEVGLHPKVPGFRGLLQAVVCYTEFFRDGIMRCKFIADSCWSEFGLAMKAHGSALCPGDLMAGKS